MTLTNKQADKLARRCETCDEYKVNEQFYRNNRGALTYECKACHTERMRPTYRAQAAARRAKECERLGLPATATDEEMSAAEHAAFREAWKNAGPFDIVVRVDLTFYPRRTEGDEARYQQVRREQYDRECLDSELKEAHGLTDAQIEARPEGERARLRMLRDMAASWSFFPNGVRKGPHSATEQTDLSRRVESMLNPTPAMLKARAQRKAWEANRDPLKKRLSAARRNLKKNIETAEKQAKRRAWLTALAGDALRQHGGQSGVRNSLSIMERDEYLNEQAQAKWRAEIEALENAMAGH